MNELARWDPFRAIAPFEDSFFAIPSLFRPSMARAAGPAPRMDISENENAYQLTVELAGVKKDAIQVNVYENSVTISAELAEEQNGNDTQWLLRERGFGKFTRTVALPEAVDDEASEARYTDGVLHLTLKKKSASQTKRLTVH
jgi:HSP20 family protein